jgi:uncharacterized protein (DUF885 family)
LRGFWKAGLVTGEEADALTQDLTSAMKDEMKPAYDPCVSLAYRGPRQHPLQTRRGSVRYLMAAYDDAMLKQMTTTEMTADEIHELGLQEVARIRKEMEAIKNAVGFKGDLEEFFTFMRTDRRFYFPNTDEGREEHLALARTYLDGMNKKLPEYSAFAEAPLEVRRVEAFREEPGGAQHYFAGAPDGSRPGSFDAHSLRHERHVDRSTPQSIAFHEGNPGHHMQISIAQEREGLPADSSGPSTGYTAYSEGGGFIPRPSPRRWAFRLTPTRTSSSVVLEVESWKHGVPTGSRQQASIRRDGARSRRWLSTS